MRTTSQRQRRRRKHQSRSLDRINPSLKIKSQIVTLYDLPVGAMPYSTRDDLTGVIYSHQPIDQKPVGAADNVTTDTTTEKDQPWLMWAAGAWIAWKILK